MSNSRFLPRPARLRRGGFSLVEVTLAIGIVAFAFVALFGLVPTGLNVFRSAIDASIGSQILDQVVQNAQQTDYQRLLNDAQPTLGIVTFYDEQGNLLVDELGKPIQDGDPKMAQSIYSVSMAAKAPTPVPSGGQNDASSITSNVATLTVRVGKNPSHVSASTFFGANSSYKSSTNTYIAYVARNKSAFETR